MGGFGAAHSTPQERGAERSNEPQKEVGGLPVWTAFYRGSGGYIVDGEELFYYLQIFRVWYVMVPTFNHYLQTVYHLVVLQSVVCCCDLILATTFSATIL